MNPLYVGIDVSSKSNVVYFMLPDGSKHCNFSVANSHTGSSQLVKRILSAMTSCSLENKQGYHHTQRLLQDLLKQYLRSKMS